MVLLAFLLVASDLGAKALARWGLRASDLELGPFLALRLRFNEGSTFGLLPAGSATWLVAGVVVFVAIFGWWFAPRSGSIALGAAVVSAGGTGNLADRWLQGRVTDFVAIRVSDWQLPIFNLADTFLVLGVLIILWPRPKPDA
ncbi:MAG: signal peptidase II [Devosia sp.]|nr:signal peptidase II [Devosia sp.]